MDATAFDITNITIEFELESTSAADNIHWKMVDSSTFHFDHVAIKMKSGFLQKLVDLSRKLIDDMINKEMPQLSKFIDSKIQAINAGVATEGPLTFVVPVYKDVSLNLTMSQAPDLSTQDLIKVYFDGLVLQNNKTYNTIAGIPAPPRKQHYLSEQIWLHENMLDSLFDAVSPSLFPLELKNSSISD